MDGSADVGFLFLLLHIQNDSLRLYNLFDAQRRYNAAVTSIKHKTEKYKINTDGVCRVKNKNNNDHKNVTSYR